MFTRASGRAMDYKVYLVSKMSYSHVASVYFSHSLCKVSKVHDEEVYLYMNTGVYESTVLVKLRSEAELDIVPINMLPVYFTIPASGIFHTTQPTSASLLNVNTVPIELDSTIGAVYMGLIRYNSTMYVT